MKDTIYRADAIEAVREYFRTQLEDSGGEWSDELQEYVFSEEDKRILTYNKGVCTALKALPSAEPTGNLISQEDVIETVCRTRCGDKAKGCPAHSCPVIEEFEALPSAETHEIRTETHGVCSDLISRDDAMGAVQEHFNAHGFKDYHDGQQMMDRITALPSAKGGDAEMNEVKPQYMRSSPSNGADLTCATCADRAACIMSAPDGNWKACKDYRPSAEAEEYEDYEHATLVDIKAPLRASAEAVQGEWVRCEGEIKDLEGNILCHVYWYECNKCGSRPPRKKFEKQEWLSDFCPNCGAKMSKGGDSE